MMSTQLEGDHKDNDKLIMHLEESEGHYMIHFQPSYIVTQLRKRIRATTCF